MKNMKRTEIKEEAWAELCQAQVKPEVIVDVLKEVWS